MLGNILQHTPYTDLSHFVLVVISIFQIISLHFNHLRSDEASYDHGKLRRERKDRCVIILTEFSLLYIEPRGVPRDELGVAGDLL